MDPPGVGRLLRPGIGGIGKGSRSVPAGTWETPDVAGPGPHGTSSFELRCEPTSRNRMIRM